MNPVTNSIKDLRAKKGWNRGEMSRRSGVKVHTLWGIEKYQRDIPVSRAFKIARAFNLPIEDVFQLNGEAEEK